MPVATSLAITHPNLTLEWSLTLNQKHAESYSKGSVYKAWWNCPEGHPYEASIHARVKGTGCPYCSGRKALPGVTDVATLHPHLIPEWHPENDVSLQTFRPGSQEKGLWLCPKGHQWEAKIRDRVNGSGCHICAGKKILIGYNDLATTHPFVASLWDYEKNSLNPKEVMGKSEKKVFFRCSKGHQWENSPSRQAEVSSGCSYCAGRKALQGDNDLLTLHPEIASEWNPTKNGNLLPSMITGTMDKKVWWKGKCGHEWESTIHSRVGQSQGCPYCAGRKTLAGFNDLATKHPELASEWDKILNGALKPEMFTRGSNQKVHWKCNKDHSWIATINYRTCVGKGLSCPICSNLENISAAEKDIVAFLRDKGIVVKQSNRSILDGRELDILLPEYLIAIEFNGLYWHTENKGKDKNYHYDKWFKAKQKGIQLIHVWEDEWKAKPQIIKNILVAKIENNNNKTAPLIKEKVSKISEEKAKIFLEAYSLQEFSAGSFYLGIEGKDGLKEVMGLNNFDKGLKIVQYASTDGADNGFRNFLAYISFSYPTEDLIACSDNRLSHDEIYLENGFIANKMIAPDYRYVIGNKRVHKEAYTAERFHVDPNLIWEQGLDEEDLGKINGIYRIWDAGQTQWMKPGKMHYSL